MYYITRRCSGVAMERRKSTPDASPSVLVGERKPFVCAIQFLTTLIRIPTYIVADLYQGFAKIMVMCAASRFFVLPLQDTGTGVLAWSAPPLLSSY